jgi:hypothetical protein
VRSIIRNKRGQHNTCRSAVRATGITLRSATILLILPVCGIGDIQTTTQTLSASISPAGKISVPASVTLTSSGTQFGTFGGSLLVSYWASTSGGGSGSVVVQASSEFTPSGGPTAGTVTYYCTGATLGTGCSGTQTIQTSSQTSVVSLPGGVCTGGGGSCSSQAPNTVQLQFQLPNKPQYKTGTYSAQLMFTISTL